MAAVISSMARRKSQTDIADEPAHKTPRRSASRYRVPLPDRHRSRTKNSVAPGADGDSIDAMGLEPMPSSSMFEAAAEQRQQKNQQMMIDLSDLSSIKAYEARHKNIIDPSSSSWMKRWDLLMVVALAFTAVITPVEVAFLDEGGVITMLWWINRLVDFCFLVDMLLTFNLAYEEKTARGTHYVFSRKLIACHYLKGWFLIDLFSIAPFFLITLDYADPWGNNVVLTQAEDGAPNAMRATVLFRIVKLLRMLKLARVFKASRVLERTVLDVVLTDWEWTFAMLKLLKFAFFLFFYAHLQACVYGLVSSFLPPPTWLSEFDAQYEGFEGPEGQAPHPLERYAAALYWSVMTLTSIGYGEMTPVNSVERWMCSLYMFLSGILWTYAIGSVAAIATTLNPNQVMYETTMDQLNLFMRERQLPREMRIVLRDFVKSARRINQLNDDAELLGKLSPELQATVALAANREWLGQIYFFRELWGNRQGTAFIAALARHLVIRNFVAKERIPVGQLYVVRRGLVVKMWRFLGARRVWGEDFILNDRDELVDHSQAVALSYVEVYTLRKFALTTLFADHPYAEAMMQRAARRIAVQRALLTYLVRVNGGKGPRSFVPRSMANEPDIVEDEFTMAQKVDMTVAKLFDVSKELTDLKGMMHILVNKMGGSHGVSKHTLGGAAAAGQETKDVVLPMSPRS